MKRMSYIIYIYIYTSRNRDGPRPISMGGGVCGGARKQKHSLMFSVLSVAGVKVGSFESFQLVKI